MVLCAISHWNLEQSFSYSGRGRHRVSVETVRRVAINRLRVRFGTDLLHDLGEWYTLERLAIESLGHIERYLVLYRPQRSNHRRSAEINEGVGKAAQPIKRRHLTADLAGIEEGKRAVLERRLESLKR